MNKACYNKRWKSRGELFIGSEPIKLCVITTVSITLRAFLLEQLVYLSQNGFDVTVVCEYDPIFVRDCPPELKYIPVHMTRKIGWWSTFVGWWKLFRLFKREKFRMIQYSTPKAALISSLAGFIAGIPIRLYCQWGIYYVGIHGPVQKVFKSIEKFTWLNFLLMKVVLFVDLLVELPKIKE